MEYATIIIETLSDGSKVYAVRFRADEKTLIKIDCTSVHHASELCIALNQAVDVTVEKEPLSVLVLVNEKDEGVEIIDVFASQEALNRDQRSKPSGWGSPTNLKVYSYRVEE